MRSLKEARALFEDFPKTKLGFFPTPCYKLERMSSLLGIELYIKRDDFTGMSLFGGNKIRKLEYLIGDAVAKGSEYVFTFGATQSNHAMQTACACRRCGLKPVLYLVAVVRPDPNDLRSNLLLDRILGAEVHVIEIQKGETEAEAEERALVMARAHMERLEAEGHRCYEVPMGGASVVGSIGFAEGFLEMEEQMADLGAKPQYLFHATGTGGTMAGLQAGRKLAGSEIEICSVNVSEKSAEYPDRCAALANSCLSLLGVSGLHVSSSQDIHLDPHYYLPGYEIPNPAASEAICTLAREKGLFLDPVYTGKAFAGLFDYVRSGKVKKGSTVLFWHTGGATALFAEKEILGEIG